MKKFFVLISLIIVCAASMVAQENPFMAPPVVGDNLSRSPELPETNACAELSRAWKDSIGQDVYKALTEIRVVVNASTLPIGQNIASKDSARIIATVENHVLTMYTKKPEIYLPEISTNLFYASYNSEASCYEPALTALDATHFNTSNVTNMYAMFGNCRKLQSLDLSHFNTSKVTDMGSMFNYCDSLKTLNISSFNTENVTNMSNMFELCISLTSLDVSHFNTGKVTNMASMFGNCRTITILDVSHFNTSNVTSMSSMFWNCYSLTELNVSNFNTEKVTTMGGMFTNCYLLTSLDVSHFNTSNVTRMSNMFSGCKGLTSLDLTHFNTENVTTMSWMFEGASALTEIDLSSFNTGNVTDMYGMFSSCRALKVLDLSNFDMSKVEDVRTMLQYSYVLDSLKTPRTYPTASLTCELPNLYSEQNSWYANGARPAYTDMLQAPTSTWLTLLPIITPSAELSEAWKGSIGLEAYKALTEIRVVVNAATLPEGQNIASTDSSAIIATIEDSVLTMYTKKPEIYLPKRSSSLFSGIFVNSDYVSSLKSIDLSHFNTEYVDDMWCMFTGCTEVTTLDVSHFNTSNVTDMGQMFYCCYKLTSLDVSNFNTSNVRTMARMFGACHALTTIDVTNFNTLNVTDMREMFFYGRHLESLDLSHFNTEKVTNMYNMFYGCESLSSLDISSFDMSNVENAEDMVYSASGLDSLKTPSEYPTTSFVCKLPVHKYERLYWRVNGYGQAYTDMLQAPTNTWLTLDKETPSYVFTEVADNIEVGALSVDSNLIAIRRQFAPGVWETLNIPFTVDSVQVEENGAYYDLDAHVQGSENGHYWLSTLPENATIETEWVENTTALMPQRNQPYIIMVPEDYYEEKPIVFYGKRSTLENAVEPARPTLDYHFTLAGNTTLTTLTKTAYMLDEEGLNFDYRTQAEVAPSLCYLLSNQATPSFAPSIRFGHAIATPLEKIETENGAAVKVYENNQVVIIRDGVRYTVLGVIID